MHASRAALPSAYTGTHPSLLWCTPCPSRPSIRGIDGPVRSTSRIPTRAVGDDARSESASCVDTDDLPTPPLPEQTMMMCLTCRSRRPTGVSSTGLLMAMALPADGDRNRGMGEALNGL